jgi:hypothetical protein
MRNSPVIAPVASFPTALSDCASVDGTGRGSTGGSTNASTSTAGMRSTCTSGSAITAESDRADANGESTSSTAGGSMGAGSSRCAGGAMGAIGSALAGSSTGAGSAPEPTDSTPVALQVRETMMGLHFGARAPRQRRRRHHKHHRIYDRYEGGRRPRGNAESRVMDESTFASPARYQSSCAIGQ